jgi:hypothetical protein
MEVNSLKKTTNGKRALIQYQNYTYSRLEVCSIGTMSITKLKFSVLHLQKVVEFME